MTEYDKCFQECDYCKGWWDKNGPFQEQTNTCLGISEGGEMKRKICSQCLIKLLDKTIGFKTGEVIGYR